MRIDITGDKMDVTPALRDYCEDKLGKLGKHFEHHLDTKMILTVDNLDHRAEATLHTPGRTVYADASAPDMYAAIDLLADKLDRLLLKHKGKVVDHHRGANPARSGDFA
jgi:putative sigma-54 modulation protein